MLKKWLVLILTVVFMLSACNSPVYNQTENNIADVKIKSRVARQQSDDNARVRPSLVMNKGLYVDQTPISLYRNPPWLRDHIVIKGEQLPFSYYSRTVAGGAGHNILTRYQDGLDQGSRVSMNYSGTVRGALDLLSARTGYSYAVHGNTVYWQAFISKTFDIAFMPGGTDYLMGKKSGSGSGSSPSVAGAQTQNYTTTDGASDQYSNFGGKLSIWKDLNTTIQQMLSPDGKVMVSEATTSVTVRDRPTNVALVEQYITNLNKNISRQVLVKIQILQVDLNNTYNMGIDWQIVAKSFHNSPFVLNAAYGTPISLTGAAFSQQAILPGTMGGPYGATAGAPSTPQFGTVGNGKIPSYTILFNALTQQGKTSVVTEPRVVCLNNQVSVIKITEQKGYVASIQNTTLASGGTAPTSTVTSQITPGNIITGITLYILPKILGKRIYMQVNADLSINTALVDAGPVGSTIQLPTIDSKSFNQRSVIRTGETLILSGFRQMSNQANAMQLMKSQALGGKASIQSSTETVVLITPIVLDGAA